MSTTLEYVTRTNAAYPEWSKKLAIIFNEMDDHYIQAAEHYGFTCRGCEDSCCLTRFYHHTLLEYVHIDEGFEQLLENKRKIVKTRAAEYCRKHGAADAAGTRADVMCPLNFDGLCAVYQFRPMICRLHGISHELHRPGRSILYGLGCDRFTAKSEGKSYYPFDRTPFYKAMAGLEKEFRQMLGVNEKVKLTLAEMIVSF